MNQFAACARHALRQAAAVLSLVSLAAAQTGPPQSTITVTAASPTLVLPGSVALKATVNAPPVAGGVPTGNVTFSYDGTNPLGSAPLQLDPTTETFPPTPFTGALASATQSNINPTAFSVRQSGQAKDTLRVLEELGPINTQLALVLQTYSGTGTQIFAAPPTTETLLFNPNTIVYSYDSAGFGAFNGNAASPPGLLVHAILGGSSQYSVFFADANGGFATSTSVDTPDTAQCQCSYPNELIQIDDFKEDGFADVAYMTRDSPNQLFSTVSGIGVRINAGASKPGDLTQANPLPFPPPTIVGQSSYSFCPTAFASGTFTASGHKDLLVEGYYSTSTTGCSYTPAPGLAAAVSTVALYTGNGDGTFGATTLLTNTGIPALPVIVATGDFNKDGFLDLVVAGSSSAQILYGQGNGQFTPGTVLTLPADVFDIRVADLNGDGFLDLAVTTASQNAGVGVAPGSAKRRARPFASSGGGTDETTLFLNDGKGNFSAQGQQLIAPSVAPLLGATVGDFNGDGLPDVAVLDSANPGTAYAFFNSASANAALNTAPQTLPAGTHAITATFPGDANFTASTSAAISEVVTQTVPTITWPAPAPIVYPAPLSAAQLDATATVPGIFTYTPPAGTVLSIGARQPLTAAFVPVDAFNYAGATASTMIDVNPPPAQATAQAPSTTPPREPQSINFTLAPYPLDVTVTLTLSFTPNSQNAPKTNGSVVFAQNSKQSYSFVIPANSTGSVPPIMFSSGTVAGAISIGVQLISAQGNVTPAGLGPLTTTVAPGPPGITSATLTRSGSTMQMVILGYSPTREMTQAQFHLTAAVGKKLQTTDVPVTLTQAANNWYSNTTSDQSGSSFTYTQPFTLDGDANAVGSVSVTLTNGQGASQAASAQ